MNEHDARTANARPAGNAWRILVDDDARGATLHARLGDADVGRVRVDVDVGGELARYWYRLGWLVLASPELGLHHRVRTLMLCNDLTGACELSGLETDARLDAATRQAAVDRLVTGAVLWLRASARGSDEGTIFAELGGVRTGDGHAPFWEALGRRFYEGEPSAAAARFGPAWRSHVAALLPRESLLASFLDESAQRAIGVVGDEFSPIAEALRAAGLRSGTFVTIDDAGPVYTAPRDALPAWRRAAHVVARAAEPVRQTGVGAAARSATDDELNDASGAWLVAVDARTMIEVQGMRTGDELAVTRAGWRDDVVGPQRYWAAPVAPA
jgi:arginine/ornithine succinyltransferase subunit-like protein